MATPVILPRQGQSVESCIIGEWHKKVGDSVAVGDEVQRSKIHFCCHPQKERTRLLKMLYVLLVRWKYPKISSMYINARTFYKESVT